MSYSALNYDVVEAQVSENTLKSITNQTNVNALTRAQISVGENPSFIETLIREMKLVNSEITCMWQTRVYKIQT